MKVIWPTVTPVFSMTLHVVMPYEGCSHSQSPCFWKSEHGVLKVLPDISLLIPRRDSQYVNPYIPTQTPEED